MSSGGSLSLISTMPPTQLATSATSAKTKAPLVFHCAYCNVTETTQEAFRGHCDSEAHMKTILSDEGKAWKYRMPPRGVESGSYVLCNQKETEGKKKKPRRR